MTSTFETILKYYDVEFANGGSIVIGFKQKKLSNDEVMRALGSVNFKHQKNLLKDGVDPLLYIKENLPNRYNGNVVLILSEHMSSYNKIFRVFDNNPVVYDWPLDKVLELCRLPPDPVSSILDEYYANPYAVMRFYSWENVSFEQFTRGFKVDTLVTVRSYFVNEDPWILKTGVDENEINNVLKLLFKLGMVEYTRGYYIPKLKKKGKWLKWRSTPSVEDLVLDWYPSFAMIRKFKSVDFTIPKYNKPVQIEINQVIAFGKNALVVTMDVWATKSYKRESTPFENLREYKPNRHNNISKVVFLFGNSQATKAGLYLPHVIFNNRTRMDGACYALENILKTNNLTFFCANY